MDMIAIAKDLFAAIRAGDWQTIIRLVAVLVPVVLDSLGGQPPPVPAMALAKSPVAKQTIEELTDEAEAAINQCAPQGTAAAPMQGPIIDALKPLIGKLLLKLILGIG